MQTNGAGGHQHEAPDKHTAPGAFPCRLDMEICACGAKRRVDQDGTPATPWQSSIRDEPGGTGKTECKVETQEVQGRPDHQFRTD